MTTQREGLGLAALGKFYAVRRGSTTGIFTSWEDCRGSVSGYPGAEYKSFKTKEEADAYLGYKGQPTIGKTPVQSKARIASGYEELPEHSGISIYVDGSYNSATEEFSYGMVVLREDGEETYSRKFEDSELAAMHNVAGEIKGAEAAMQYALDHELKEIAIYHDYEGIAKWCLGEWKTNKDGTRAYKAFYDSIRSRVSIKFVKVTGHSNNKYNDMADRLAKEALGIE